MPGGIIICGLNGSGKTSLGSKLAASLGFKHMDIEDYCFLPSDTPYSFRSSREEWERAMLRDIHMSEGFVITAVSPMLCSEINSLCRLTVYLSAPLETRLARMKNRSIEKFGERVMPGGDMYESENKFYEFAAGRLPDSIEKQLDTLGCPVICADGARAVSFNVKYISEEWKKLRL